MTAASLLAGFDDGLRPVRGRGGVWRAAPGREDELLGPHGPPLAKWREEGRLTVVKNSSHRTVWRLRLDPGPNGEERIAFLKLAAGGRGGVGRALIDPGRPFREARAAARVTAAGVATAAPLLAGRFDWTNKPPAFDGFNPGAMRRRGPARALITCSVEPAVPLPTLLAAGDRLAPATRRAITDALAQSLARMHAAGLFPGDLHPGNLFVRGLESTADGGFERPEGTELEPVLIDLAPLFARRGWPGARRRIAASLGMLAHGTAGTGSDRDRLRFLAAHRAALGEATGADPAATLGPWEDWATTAETVRQKESRSRHARRDRHWRRGCRGMRTVDRQTRCVAGLTDEDAARLLAATSEEPAGAPAAVSGDGRAVRVLRLSPAAARTGWEIGHGLRRRGVPVAEPLALRQERHAGTLVVAAGAPIGPDPAHRQAAQRLCERLRAWGYTLDGPREEDFYLAADGSLALANPAAVRRAGGDEPAPTPEFDPLADYSSTAPIRKAA